MNLTRSDSQTMHEAKLSEPHQLLQQGKFKVVQIDGVPSDENVLAERFF